MASFNRTHQKLALAFVMERATRLCKKSSDASITTTDLSDLLSLALAARSSTPSAPSLPARCPRQGRRQQVHPQSHALART